MIVSAIVVALIVFVSFYAIAIYNQLVKLKNLVAEAWSGVEEDTVVGMVREAGLS